MKEFTCLFVLFFIALVSAEAEWSAWMPRGVCTAKPCNCNNRASPKCAQGKRVEIRFCHRSMDDPPCAYDTNGPLRLIECHNNGTNCPGWSKWHDAGIPCNCDVDDNNYKKKVLIRKCDNPPWHYNSVKCPDRNGELIAEEEEQWFIDEQCTCEITTTPIPTTVTTEVPTTIPQECLEDYDEAYGDESKEKSDINCDYYYIAQ